MIARFFLHDNYAPYYTNGDSIQAHLIIEADDDGATICSITARYLVKYTSLRRVTTGDDSYVTHAEGKVYENMQVIFPPPDLAHQRKFKIAPGEHRYDISITLPSEPLPPSFGDTIGNSIIHRVEFELKVPSKLKTNFGSVRTVKYYPSHRDETTREQIRALSRSQFITLSKGSIFNRKHRRESESYEPCEVAMEMLAPGCIRLDERFHIVLRCYSVPRLGESAREIKILHVNLNLCAEGQIAFTSESTKMSFQSRRLLDKTLTDTPTGKIVNLNLDSIKLMLATPSFNSPQLRIDWYLQATVQVSTLHQRSKPVVLFAREKIRLEAGQSIAAPPYAEAAFHTKLNCGESMANAEYMIEKFPIRSNAV